MKFWDDFKPIIHVKMENNKTLLLGIGAAAVVVLGGIAYIWGNKPKRDKIVVEEEDGPEDGPMTRVIMWYEENMPKLYIPGIEAKMPIPFAEQAKVMDEWAAVREAANLRVDDPSSLDRLMDGTTELLTEKTANGDWDYLQALFLLTMLGDAAELFGEKEFLLNAHIVMKDEYRRMNRVHEMHYMSSLVGRYLFELGFYEETEIELTEVIKYTQPLVDERERTDLQKYVHIRIRALTYLMRVELSKKIAANVAFAQAIEDEIRDIVERFPAEPICIEVAEQLKNIPRKK